VSKTEKFSLAYLIIVCTLTVLTVVANAPSWLLAMDVIGVIAGAIAFVLDK
jgi:hypothetical protein